MENPRSLERKRAAAAGTRPPSAVPDAVYYQRLETGARWLASRSGAAAERDVHLVMANRYARLGLDAAGAGRR